MKCQYDDQIDKNIKSKDIYKYFFKTHSASASKTNNITPDSYIDVVTNLSNYAIYPWLEMKFHKIKNSSVKQNSCSLSIINLLEITNKNSKDNFSFIYSSDNLSNLNENIPFLIDLSTQLKIDIFAYEYSDYAHTQTNKAHKKIIIEENLNEDLKQVIKFVSKLNESPKRLVLISNSVGSIPSLNYIVTNNSDKFLIGLILISPVGISLKDEKNSNLSESLEQINFPVFIIHSRKDSYFNYHKSVNLGIKIRNLIEWYPKNGDHYNLIAKNRPKFLAKLKFFVKLINSTKSFENKENAHATFSCKNLSFKFEDNFIIPQNFNDNYDERNEINLTVSKMNYRYQNFTNGTLNTKSGYDLYNWEKSKLIQSSENNILIKSTCSSIKDESQINKPSPFSKKVDSLMKEFN